jgi:hypothetical protein
LAPSWWPSQGVWLSGFSTWELVLQVVSGHVHNLGDGVQGPFHALEVRDSRTFSNGVVLFSTGSTGFRNAAALH